MKVGNLLVLVILLGLALSARDTWSGKGLRIDREGEYPIVVLAGTPQEMGRQHGELCKADIARTYECLMLVAGGELFLKGDWFFETIAEAQRRTLPSVPQRFLVELDAMSEAAGLSAEQGRQIGFFPELFHCSGIAARGKATRNGQVVHVRVLDYLRDIGLEASSLIQVFIPDGYHPWISVGFAGFNGTVTAMNACGLAMGEMGGRGEGNWDGLPMSYLMRQIMEECSTVTEAMKLICETPLTCEYYYVLSDKSGDMVTVEAKAGQEPLFLRPGEAHPLLLEAFEDVAWITAPSRQKALCERVREYYGRIDAETMKEIVRRPVAMTSNLHDAIFLPETQEMHFSYASGKELACDRSYSRVKLQELLAYYRAHLSQEK